MNCVEFQSMSITRHPADVTAAEFAAGMTHLSECRACAEDCRRASEEGSSRRTAEENSILDRHLGAVSTDRAAECVADPEIGPDWLRRIGTDNAR